MKTLRTGWSEHLSAREAQLVLSFIVWPREAPDPRLVDEWLRRVAHAGDGPEASPGHHQHSI